MSLYKPKYIDRKGRKRESTVWWCRARVGGREVRFSTGHRDKPKADAIADLRLDEIRDGRAVVGGGKVTYTTLMDGLEEHYRVNGNRSGDRLEVARRLHLDPFFKRYRAAQLTPTAFRRYQAKRLAEDAANATVNRELQYVRAAMRRAKKLGEIAEMPDVPMLTEAAARDVTLDNDGELAALLEALPEHHRGWVALAACTGWRRNAVLSRK